VNTKDLHNKFIMRSYRPHPSFSKKKQLIM